MEVEEDIIHELRLCIMVVQHPVCWSEGSPFVIDMAMKYFLCIALERFSYSFVCWNEILVVDY